MKAKNLQIGDYVNYRGQIIKVTSLYDKGGSNEVGWSDKESVWVNADNVEPIPLTPEILEKNGFTGGKYENYCGNVFYLSVDGFREVGLTMSYKDNILWCERINQNYPNSIGDKYAIHHLEYVHELQHALRLCRIKKEIIL